MFRTELLLILPLVVAVTVGQANRPAPVLEPALAAPSYAPLLNPRPLSTPVYKPLLPPRDNTPAPPGVTPPQPCGNGEPQPPVTEGAPPLQPVEANTLKAPILPEPAVDQPASAPIPILASQTGESVAVQPAPELVVVLLVVPTTEPTPVAEQSPAPEPIQPSAVVSEPIPQLEYIPQPEPTQEIVQAQELAVLPERNAVPFPEPPPNPVTAPKPTSISSASVVLPHLLPKPQLVREPAFGRRPQPSASPMIYHPTVTYPTQTPSNSYPPTPPGTVATQALPVLVTTQSHPAVTQALRQLKFDFQCKEENGYYSVEHECDTYIECKQNRAIKHTCPDGLHFNPAAKQYDNPCAYPSEVKCMAGYKEQNPKPTEKCPNQYGFYSMNDGDCSRFIMCQEGLATIKNCPMGLVFNPQTSTCDWPVNVPQCNPNVFKDFTCPDPPDDEDGQVSDIIYKYRFRGQCKLFIACQLGYPRLLSCEHGLSFDDASQTCIDEDYVTDCSVS